MKNLNPQELLAWKAVKTFTILMSCVLPIAVIVTINAVNLPLWPWVVAMLVSFIFLVLVLRQKSFSVVKAAIVYITITGLVLLASSLTTHNFGIPREGTAFAGYKALSLVIAIIAPLPSWIGYLMISLCLFIPPVQALVISPQVMTIDHGSEPWFSMVYAIIGFVIYNYRLDAQRAQMELLELRANENSFKNFSDVVLALRDLTNTPLQSLSLLVEMMKKNQITMDQASDALSKTTYKLWELASVLNEVQKKIPNFKNRTSMDSLDILRKKLDVSADQSEPS